MTTEIRITVVGTMWMGGTGSMEYVLDEFRNDNLDKWTSDDVEEWLSTHTGDFASVVAWDACVIETTRTQTPIKLFTEEEEDLYWSTLPDEEAGE